MQRHQGVGVLLAVGQGACTEQMSRRPSRRGRRLDVRGLESGGRLGLVPGKAADPVEGVGVARVHAQAACGPS